MNKNKLRPAKRNKHSNITTLNNVLGFWKILDEQAYTQKDNSYGSMYFLCQCVKCNNTVQYVNITQLLKTSKMCKQCSDVLRTDAIGDKSANWKGCGEIPMSYVHNIRNAAERRNIPFNVTIEYIWNVFLDQERRCKLSGVPLNFYVRNKIRNGTASLDRIDRTKPYEPGNVQWVHKDVNEMKWDKSDEELIRWCKLIMEHNT